MGEPLEITVIVNGESRAVPTGSTAGDLVEALGLAGRPLAVEVNEEVVPRARLADCRLQPGDRLDPEWRVLTPA